MAELINGVILHLKLSSMEDIVGIVESFDSDSITLKCCMRIHMFMGEDGNLVPRMYPWMYENLHASLPIDNRFVMTKHPVSQKILTSYNNFIKETLVQSIQKKVDKVIPPSLGSSTRLH